jgi:hypothetical protein
MQRFWAGLLSCSEVGLVLSLVHHTHAATTELLDDAVMRYGLADERVGVRHSAAILAPATALRWLYEPETPVESSMSLEPRSYNAGTTWLGS